MRFFKKKKVEEVVETVSIAMKLDKEGKIDLSCSWPEVNSKEEAEKIAKEFAEMVCSTYKPEVMPYIQTTIANHGVKTNSQKLSNYILIFINSLLNPRVVDNHSPVVTPRNAFQVRGDNS